MAKKNAVGLDIGTRTVHLAHVQQSRGQPTVVNFGGVELPVGAVREGEIVDVQEATNAVKELVGSTGLKEKEVWVGVANQRVVVRQVDLPYMPEDELRASLRFQVQEFIPIPVEDAELDFHVLDEFQGDGDARMQRLLLVAAHKDMIATHIAAATEAGLRPVGVDLNPFAVLRTLASESLVEATSEVLVDVGAGVTNIVVHEAGVPKFVRILVLGGEDITEALVNALSLPYEEAEALKKRTGLKGPEASGDTGASIIEEHAGQFVDEIRSSLDYYQAQTGSTRLSRVVLAGGGALLSGLPDRLARVLRLPVEVGRPFDFLPTKGTVFGPEQLAQVGPVLTTALGLALGGTE